MRKELRNEIKDILKIYGLHTEKVKNHFCLFGESNVFHNTYCTSLRTLLMYIKEENLQRIAEELQEHHKIEAEEIIASTLIEPPEPLHIDHQDDTPPPTNEYFIKISKRGYGIDITSQKFGFYYVYLTKGGMRTHKHKDRIQFRSTGTPKELIEKAPYARKHTNLSNALLLLSRKIPSNE